MNKDVEKSLFGAAPSIKKKIRRRVVKEENVAAIKAVLKEITDQDVTLEQFVSLISPHTGDRGELLTKIMSNDVNAFRRMVIKVYDTMTADVGDVLANEQVELAKMYDERHQIAVDKIIRSVQEIKDIYPPFLFADYQINPPVYLAKMFKNVEMPDESDIETAKGHIAYHRLEWLRSEGERLQKENAKLTKRLNELKKQQKKGLQNAVKKESEIEQQNLQLAQTEQVMEERLDELNRSLQETIIQHTKKESEMKKETVKKKAKKKKLKAKPAWVDVEPEEWNVGAAAEIETTNLAEHLQSEVSRMSITASARRGSPMSSTKIPSPEAISMRQELIEQIKSPPRVSPTRTSPQRISSPGAAGAAPPSMQIPPQLSQPGPSRERTETCVPCSGRRVQGPRDSWGGFY